MKQSIIPALLVLLIASTGASSQLIVTWGPGEVCNNGAVLQFEEMGAFGPAGAVSPLIGMNGDMPVGTLSFLVVSTETLDAPFYGGVLGPTPMYVLAFGWKPGTWFIPMPWMSLIPGTVLWMQGVVVDGDNDYCTTPTLMVVI
jgi:hypothetical protein